MIVNAGQAKNLPGRKTDVSDAARLTRLGAHNLVRPLFVPPAAVPELQDLTRARTQVIRQQGQITTSWRSCWRTPVSSSPRSPSTSLESPTWPGWKR
ncbi:transposase [Streptomyces sp. NPDC013178]|uniref:IS110 family transposase n=1 Tax=Streptomyces sp. NPDC013178 TaxID=3155118 RepID=UPI0033F9841E